MNLKAILLTLIASVEVYANIDEYDPSSMKLKKLSLGYPYIDDGFHIKDWDYGGNAVIDAANGIYLTTDLPSNRGWLWSTKTLPEDSWLIDFDFKIGSKNKDHLYGDGLAFWATQSRAISGPVFGNRDRFTGLGVFFDTYANGLHNRQMPLVVAMMGDGIKSYDPTTDGLTGSLANSDGIEYRQTDEPVKCRITYIAGKYLNVAFYCLLFVKLRIKEDFVDCFTRHHWSTKWLVALPLPPPFFLSSNIPSFSKISCSDSHVITYIKTRNLTEEEASQILAPKPSFQQQAQSNNSNFLPTLIKLVVVCSVLGGIYYAYQAYNRRNTLRL
ncbi:L-type lectin-like domain-containing protein [Smittium mucronatum]|uniref:L-type lectin-like domain-containing protein n=1 Tax=Smittium mucronatum TaxID=133383 RepID=A0A1R0H4M2_9FUNG|nr:L-type lectin-like domain-containing protein [Smittium mucronatum]